MRSTFISLVIRLKRVPARGSGESERRQMHATGRQPAANSAHHRFLAAVTGCWAAVEAGPGTQCPAARFLSAPSLQRSVQLWWATAGRRSGSGGWLLAGCEGRWRALLRCGSCLAALGRLRSTATAVMAGLADTLEMSSDVALPLALLSIVSGVAYLVIFLRPYARDLDGNE
eukprot:COSAG01_NODE_27913_length_673_cov_114.395470_1_plen_171_part_10